MEAADRGGEGGNQGDLRGEAGGVLPEIGEEKLDYYTRSLFNTSFKHTMTSRVRVTLTQNTHDVIMIL